MNNALKSHSNKFNIYIISILKYLKQKKNEYVNFF
jgi:hypothetical protein